MACGRAVVHSAFVAWGLSGRGDRVKPPRLAKFDVTFLRGLAGGVRVAKLAKFDDVTFWLLMVLPNSTRVVATAAVAMASAVSGSIAMSTVASVPERMMLSQSMKSANVGPAKVRLFHKKPVSSSFCGSNLSDVPIPSFYLLTFSVSLVMSFFALSFTISKLVVLSVDGEKGSAEEVDVMTASEALTKHSGKHGSLCFVVRRPG